MERSRKPWYAQPSTWLVLVGLTLMGRRLIFGPHSWAQLRTVAIVAVVLVLALPLIAAPFNAYRRWRSRRLAALPDVRRVWLVNEGMAGRYLVLTGTSLGVVNASGVGRIWPLDHIRTATVGRVPVGIGIARYTGLDVEVGERGVEDFGQVVFPRWGGLLTSKSEAVEALKTIDEAREAFRRAAAVALSSDRD